MTFASREEAGRKLGGRLRGQGVRPDVVLGLPRGGVVVAAEVAKVLLCPVEVLVVRKVGHPFHREFAVGALAEGGVHVLDEGSLGPSRSVRDELDNDNREETERLRKYATLFHQTRPDLAGKNVLLVDDGMATGATAEAAVLSARKQGASNILVAAPVMSTNAAERLERVADGVEALLVDPTFDAVGRYYTLFTQTTDTEVLDLLRASSVPGSQARE